MSFMLRWGAYGALIVSFLGGTSRGGDRFTVATQSDPASRLVASGRMVKVDEEEDSPSTPKRISKKPDGDLRLDFARPDKAEPTGKASASSPVEPSYSVEPSCQAEPSCRCQPQSGGCGNCCCQCPGILDEARFEMQQLKLMGNKAWENGKGMLSALNLKGDCGDCCDCCCEPGGSCGWYAGGEVVWMKPNWSTFTAIEVENPRVGGVFTSNHRGYDYDYDPTARYFAGYTGCNGLGVRASWWEFDHDSAVESATVAAGGFVQTSFISTGVTGETITTQQDLELQTVDLEFTSCFQACGGDMVAGFGVRYAKVALGIHDRRLGVTGALAEVFDMTQGFEGLGPTVSLDFIRPLCVPGLSFYSSLRGSVVFGNLHERDRDVGTGFDDRHTFDTDKAQAIADLQVALQYCRCGWFVRGGWQAQYWDTVAHTDNDDFDAARASLGLSGFFVAIGGQR